MIKCTNPPQRLPQNTLKRLRRAMCGEACLARWTDTDRGASPLVRLCPQVFGSKAPNRPTPIPRIFYEQNAALASRTNIIHRRN